MNEFIIVDIETPYSLFPEDGIREISAIAVSSYRIVDKLHLAKIIDPIKYEEGCGAGLEAIEENKVLKDKFKEFIEKYRWPLVAHNAPFDRRFLCYWGWIDENYPMYCSLCAIRREKPGLRSYSLSAILNELGNSQEQKHTALKDTEDLLDVLKTIKPTQWQPIGYRDQYNPEYEKQLREERRQRITQANDNRVSNIFNGKKIVFTGKMIGNRTEMMEYAAKHGADVADSISKRTDILVVGEDPGSKLAKAQALSIKVISEHDFWAIIKCGISDR